MAKSKWWKNRKNIKDFIEEIKEEASWTKKEYLMTNLKINEKILHSSCNLLLNHKIVSSFVYYFRSKINDKIYIEQDGTRISEIYEPGEGFFMAIINVTKGTAGIYIAPA